MIPMGLILSEQGPAQLLAVERWAQFPWCNRFSVWLNRGCDRNQSNNHWVVIRFLCVEVASKGEPKKFTMKTFYARYFLGVKIKRNIKKISSQ